jgi:integrase
MAKWHKTTFPGVRYREHETRKHGVRFDQYFTIRYKIAGKDKEEALGWASEGWSAAKAYDRLAELKTNQRAGEGAQTLSEKRAALTAQKQEAEAEAARQAKAGLTFGAFFVHTYLPQAKADKKPRSVEREESLFKLWINPAIGKRAMRDIIPLHLEKLKRGMATKGQSPRSIEYTLSTIRHIFNIAIGSGVFKGSNPMAAIKIKKPDNARMRFLTSKEADCLLSALKEKSPDVHDMALLSLHAGLRFGEIASLTWQDVDFERGTLTIRDAKAGSRYAFLTPQAVEMLKGKDKGNPADYVFPARIRGKQIKMISISPTFARTVDELKLNEGIDDRRLRICFHSCRHSYASWLIEAGADLFTVQKLLGHKTATMTQRYGHISESRLRDAARALGAAWSRPEADQAGQVVNFQK